MTMVGKGGGNFYVITLSLAGLSIYEASATGQFILFLAATAAALMFGRRKNIFWSMAFFLGVIIAISAFAGGYFSHLFSAKMLKLVFAILLFLSGLIMFFPVREHKRKSMNKKGRVVFKLDNKAYSVNLFVALPATVLTGIASGMVGVSGGSFLVPLFQSQNI